MSYIVPMDSFRPDSESPVMTCVDSDQCLAAKVGDLNCYRRSDFGFQLVYFSHLENV